MLQDKVTLQKKGQRTSESKEMFRSAPGKYIIQ